MSADFKQAPPALLALAALHTKHSVIISSADDKIQWVNQGFCDLTGWTPEEVIGKSPGEIMNGPISDPEAVRLFQESIEKGLRVSTTIQSYPKSGPPIWLKVEKEPVYNQDGVLEHFISIETDVTGYVHQEAMLDKTERRLRDAIEALSDGFVLYDEDDRLVICNQRYKEFYASSADFIEEGERFEDLLRAGVNNGQYADALDAPEAWLARRLKAHRDASGEKVEQLLDDGRWLQIQERKTRDGGIVGIRTDVTELKKAQLDAEQARARAEVANEAKSAFLATMSHELRTPMTGIIGLLDLLGKTNLDSEQTRYVHDMHNTAKGLLVLLNDVLDLSKIEAGHLELADQVFSPADVLTDTRALFLPNAQAKGLVIDLGLAADRPSQIKGDPIRLRQVLTNLVGNAVKFTHEGRITMRLAVDGPNLVFEVSDTGIGITADRLPHIFDPFVQADSSISRGFGGTGLGLAICRRLVDAMQGELTVTSTSGTGSCFRVTLPFKAAATGRDGPSPAQSSPTDLAQLRILIVEDVALNRAIIESMLKKMGHITDVAENGAEAVRKFRDGSFDVILMDMRMPIMDGLTATRIIRFEESAGQHVPIIALTADVLEGRHGEFVGAGIDAVVTKPVDWDALQRAIHTTLVG